MVDVLDAQLPDAALTSGETEATGLLTLLRRVDRLLEQALAIAPSLYGIDAATDPYRGLHIAPDTVGRLLAREAGAPLFPPQATRLVEPQIDPLETVPRLQRLCEAFGLSTFDLDVLLIALAPELDLRYERLYAYLQDDVTRRRPSVDLALNLLCPSAEAKLARRAHFASNAPLIDHNLVHLVPEPNGLQPPLLSHYLKLDDQIVRLLVGERGVDRRLASFCRLIEPGSASHELQPTADLPRPLPALFRQAQRTGEPLRLYFQGPTGVGKRRTAEALAAAVDQPLLVADLTHLPSADVDPARLLRQLFREAWMLEAILYVEGLDPSRSNERVDLRRWLLDALVESGGVTILAGCASRGLRPAAAQWACSACPSGRPTLPSGAPAGRRTCAGVESCSTARIWIVSPLASA